MILWCLREGGRGREREGEGEGETEREREMARNMHMHGNEPTGHAPPPAPHADRFAHQADDMMYDGIVPQ